jgi:wyosine [tRNA(Phe)-imidazoG37] synthetase (radical SAM superfamily)
MKQITFEQAKEIVRRHKIWSILRARKDFTYVFPNEPFMRGYCTYLNKLIFPEKIDFDMIDIVKERSNMLAIPAEPLKKAGELFSEKIKKDKRLISKYFEDFRKTAENLDKIREKLDNINISDKNRKEALIFYQEFINGVMEIVPKGIVIWVSINGPLSNLIKNYLLSKINDEQQANDVLATLIQPLHPTYIYLEQQDLFRIIEKLPEDLIETIEKEDEAKINKLLMESKVKQDIEEHIKKYGCGYYPALKKLEDKLNRRK